MLRTGWVVALTVSGIVVSVSTADAKHPRRAWGKKSVDVPPPMVLPEDVPTPPVIEGSWSNPTAARTPRPTLRQLATARRQARAQQQVQREQLRQFQALYGNSPSENAPVIVLPPGAIAATPTPQERPRWFSRTRRNESTVTPPVVAGPQPVVPNNPIADRFELRRRRADTRATQPVGPEFPSAAPLFNGNASADDHSVLTNPPAATPPAPATDSPSWSERVREWWSGR